MFNNYVTLKHNKTGQKLQIKIGARITNRGKKITNRGRSKDYKSGQPWITNQGKSKDYKSGQKDYKTGQGLQIGAKGLQIGAGITNRGRDCDI